MLILWLRFVSFAALIVIAATQLSRNADIIAEKTGLGRAWVGALLLPVATSLPEIVTSTQATVLGNPDIALGNVFGSNMFNIFIIAVVDLFQGRGPVLYYVSSGHILSAAVGIILIGLTCLGIVIGAEFTVPVLGIGFDSLLLLAVFLGGLRLIGRYERKRGGSDDTEEARYRDCTLPRAGIVFAIAAIMIVIAGRQVAIAADELSRVTVLGGTFVGSFLVAVTTSLPELVTTLTAVRLGAYDMAIGNIMGANIMNIFIIVVTDLVYREGSVLSVVSQDNLITGFLAIVLMAIAVTGLIYRSRRSIFYLGFDAIAIIVLYFAGLGLLFASGIGI
ncbi:MAG: sodium:calcium antiporter [Firmicutes bacterium]|nr:sodium:calcium antiporter [Bacillota bacterium]